MKTFQRFLLATLVLGVVAYLLKGRDLGLPLWVVMMGAAVFTGINVLTALLLARHSDE